MTRDTAPVLFTLGHSNHGWDAFLALLRGHGIGALADVRSRPRSRFPHFNQKQMIPELEKTGIAYRWFGATLGGKPKDPTLLDGGGTPDYAAIAATESFALSIDDLVALACAEAAAGGCPAIMCSEGDPLRCHRTLLIAPALRNRGVEVRHILPGGGIMEDRERKEQLALF